MTRDELRNLLTALFGLEQDVADLTALQGCFRTILVYGTTLMIIRLGSVRFLSNASAFDVVVGIMLGSIMSRAINGSAPLLATFAAGTILIGMHWLFATVAYHTSWFGPAIKGDHVLLIKDGKIQANGMRQTNITPRDLEEAVRLQTNSTDLSGIKRAYLERNGQISLIPFAPGEVASDAEEKS